MTSIAFDVPESARPLMGDPAVTALDLAIQHVGGPSKLAKLLGVKPSVVTNWHARGVPAKWIYRVSLATGGAVPCHRFDPVAFPLIGSVADGGEGARALAGVHAPSISTVPSGAHVREGRP